ncbi:hypothetical protein HJG60_009349 [Phyllostomus discolor]|uniref:Uncharacterized protein n=1 Tax=Phyllostomus discolor TaxID=89673 RepID=A0A833YIC6_9CHIR|nr:hypothetical protein HJG60_009349 [Phyllostomus discolor]
MRALLALPGFSLRAPRHPCLTGATESLWEPVPGTNALRFRHLSNPPSGFLCFQPPCPAPPPHSSLQPQHCSELLECRRFTHSTNAARGEGCPDLLPALTAQCWKPDPLSSPTTQLHMLPARPKGRCCALLPRWSPQQGLPGWVSVGDGGWEWECQGFCCVGVVTWKPRHRSKGPESQRPAPDIWVAIVTPH